MTDYDILLWIMATAFAAGFIQGLSGFGSALVALPLLSLKLDIRSAVALVTLLGLAISTINTLHYRKYLLLRPLRPLFVGALCGIVPGLLFLTRVPEAWVMLGLGLLLTAFAADALRPHRVATATPAVLRNGFVMGLAAGGLGGAYGTNGPPAILHIASLDWPPRRQKASLSAFFLITGAMMVVAQWFGHVTTPEVLRQFAFSLLPLGGGGALGVYLFHLLGNLAYRRLTMGLILAMGVATLTKSILIL